MSFSFWFSGTDCSYGKSLWFLFKLEICGCFWAFGINKLRLPDKTLNPDCCLVRPPPDVSALAVTVLRPGSAGRSVANPTWKSPSSLHYWNVFLWGEKEMHTTPCTPSQSHCYITQKITHSVFICNHSADPHRDTAGLLKKVANAREVAAVYGISWIPSDVKEHRWFLR